MRPLTRREALICSVASLPLLAGCSGNTGDDNTTGDDSGEQTDQADGTESTQQSADGEENGDEDQSDTDDERAQEDDEDNTEDEEDESSGEDEAGDEDDTGDEDDESSGEDEEHDEEEDDESEEEWTVYQLGTDPILPPGIYEETPGVATLVSKVSADVDRYEWLEDHPEVTKERINRNLFSSFAFVFVEARGTSGCESHIEFDGVDQHGEQLIADATVVEDGSDCTDQLTYPAALLQVPIEEHPTDYEVTVTDGAGRETVPRPDPLIDPAWLDGVVRPDGDPPAQPSASDCPDGIERLPGAQDPYWGDNLPADTPRVFALRIQTEGEPTFAAGETIPIEMTNVADGEFDTSSRNDYALELLTEDDGWVEIRGIPEDEGVGYVLTDFPGGPGDGFSWEMTMDESAFDTIPRTGASIELCEPLPEGRYRFVFKGAQTPVAVSFDYTG